jgi:hypothetical protein
MDGESFCLGNEHDLASLDAARAALRALSRCSDDDERERVLAAEIRRCLESREDERPSLELERETAFEAGYEQCKQDLDDEADRARRAIERQAEAMVQP